MKKLKYLLLIFIIFLTPKVFASEYNLNSHISATRGGTKNRYSCFESYQYGSNNTCTFGTTYNGRMGQFEGFVYYPFEGQTNYTLTFNMSNDDFRNNFKSAWYWDCERNTSWTNQNTTIIMPTYVSYRKIKLNITPSENTSCVGVLIRSKNYPSDAFTGVNTWNLSSITLYDPNYQTGGGSGQGTSTPAPTPPTATNQDIINNADNNTQDIINNQNENTNDIIENANENTETLNESINSTCKDTQINLSYDYASKTGVYLDTNGNEVSGSGSAISIYFAIKPNTTYHVGTLVGSLPSGYSYCLYSATKGLLSCGALSNDTTIEANGYAAYLRLSMYNYRQMFLNGAICNNWEMETHNYLMDNSDPNISNNEFTSLFDTVSFNDPLSYLLQLPIQFINAIVNQSNSCQVVNLGTLLGVSITLPCIDIGSILGNSIWNIIDVIFSVCLLVVIFKNLYQTFANLITLGGEKEAREKFSMPTPMEFLSIILGGDK